MMTAHKFGPHKCVWRRHTSVDNDSTQMSPLELICVLTWPRQSLQSV